MYEFLDVYIVTLNEGVLQFYQTGLISKVLESKEMEYCNRLPTNTKVEAPISKYNKHYEAKRYRHNSDASVIVIMLHLTSSTRTDISYTVHQCA